MRKYFTEMVNTIHWRIQDFPEGSAITQGVCANLLLGIICAENCTEIKKLDQDGGVHSFM